MQSVIAPAKISMRWVGWIPLPPPQGNGFGVFSHSCITTLISKAADAERWDIDRD